MWELAFRDDVTLTQSPEDGSLRLEAQNFNWSVKRISQGMRTVLKMLANGRVSEDALIEQVSALDGPTGMVYFSQYLRGLSRLLCYTLVWDGKPFATLVPFSPPSTYQFQDNLVDKTKQYALSRFAYMRKDDGGELMMESLLGRAKVLLHHTGAGAMLTALAHPHIATDLASTVPDAPDALGTAFATLLLNAQVIAPVGEEGQLVEETEPSLAQWEFPDLMFHKHIRMGWKERPYGGTFRFKDKFAQLPMRKPNLSDTIVPLEKPDLDALAKSDPTFTEVVEQRRSIRQYGDAPITRAQLGEFLYRVAAVRSMVNMDGGQWSFTRRPYPNGGALYELEIYPVIHNCEGVESGLYYYNPFEHQLHKVADPNPYVNALLDMAWTSADRQSYPQVLLNLTARFQVLQWKYESVGYALIMKHVGILKQTMYLAATAMGLAPCALGGGNAEVFATAAGLNPYAETSVGEFLLGSRAK